MRSSSKCGNEVYIREDGKQSVFDLDGNKLRGDLEIASEEVKFLVWKQTQSPKLSEVVLRHMWSEMQK